MSEGEVISVEAAVYEEGEYYDEVVPAWKSDPKGPIVRTPPGSGRSGFRVVLSAMLDDGRRITENGCLGIGGRSMMRLSEIREHLSMSLGRDAELHSPEPLGWVRLIKALGESGVTSAEAELIAVPLTMCLSPAAERALTLD